MKKINSIGYAHKIIGVALFFLVIAPLVLYFLWSVIPLSLFYFLGKISFSIGLFISACFIVMLSIEFWQDKKIDKAYQKTKNSRLILKSGHYECQSCGSRQVSDTDKYCPTCGIQFIS